MKSGCGLDVEVRTPAEFSAGVDFGLRGLEIGACAMSIDLG